MTGYYDDGLNQLCATDPLDSTKCICMTGYYDIGN